MSSEALVYFLRGALALGAAVAGLVFFRFWKRTRDRFFVFFALAFWLLSINWLALGLLAFPTETRHQVFVLRLVAFVLIIVAVVDKNRRA